MRVTVIAFLLAATVSPLEAVLAAPTLALQEKAPPFVRGAPLPKWALPVPSIPETQRDEPVIQRLQDTQTWYGDQPGTMYAEAIQVNEQGALSQIGQYSISFAPSYQKLLLHKVSILRKGEMLDRTASVSLRTLEREEGLERGVYGGRVSLQMLLQDVRVGDTLLVVYTIIGSNPVFGGRAGRAFVWDDTAPIEYRRVVVTYPHGREIGWSQLGDYKTEKLVPKVEQVGGNTRLTFEGKGIEPIEMEPSTPPDYLPGRVLQVSEFSNWNSVAQWASGLFPVQRNLPSVKALARQFANLPTAADRASAALHWVQDEIRYFSVSIGENSHRPYAPEVVLRNRYGDCKDKSYLLASLLQEMGIEAQPVLVSATAPQIPRKVMPSATWFDHAIVRITIDGKAYFVDPTLTSQPESLAQLAPALPGAFGLVVDKASTDLIRLPDDDNPEPNYALDESVDISDFKGSANLTAKRSYRGGYAMAVRRHVKSLSQQSLKKWALELYEKQYPGITLLEAPSFAEEDGRFVMTTRYSLPAPVAKTDQVYKFSYRTRVLDDSLNIPDKVVRNFPFSPAFGRYRGLYRLHLNWPAKVRLGEVIHGKTTESPQLQAREDYTMMGNAVDYQIDYRIKTDRVEAGALPALQLKAKELEEYGAASFKVSEAGMSTDAALGLSLRNWETLAYLEELPERIKAFEGKKESEISPAALCQLFETLTPILDTAPPEALEKLDSMSAALGGLKGKPEVGACAATAFLMRGLFKDSAEFFASAKLPANDVSGPTHAWALWMSGEREAGLARMQSYFDSRRAVGITSASDLLGLLTMLQAAGKAIPPELKAEAGADRKGPWPRPLLAMQIGALSSSEVMSLVERMPQDAAALARNDMMFQMGHIHLASNAPEEARKAFDWFKVNGIRSTLEYALAKEESSRLALHDDDHAVGLRRLREGKLKDAAASFQKAADRGFAPAQYELGLLYQDGEGVQQDSQRALGLLRASAEQAYHKAENQMGVLYGEGGTVEKDDMRAVEWYQRAAAHGNRHAMYNLADRYVRGMTVQQDEQKALALMSESAELGNDAAQMAMARYFNTRQKGKQAEVQSLYWAKRAMQHGNSEAIYHVAEMLWYGEGVEKNEKASVALYRLAAQKGYARALTQLGFVYEFGYAVPKNPAASKAFYEAAVEKGDAGGMARLGLLYLNGIGTAKDYGKARELLEKAMARNELIAYHFLGRMYLFGLGVPVDSTKAVELLSVAANRGFSMSIEILGTAYQYAHGMPQDIEKAVYWYRKGVEQDSDLCINNLADMYENGQGVDQDFAKALELYRRAAQRGHGISLFSIGTLYAAGKGVPVDPSKAFLYMKLGDKFGYKKGEKEIEEVAKLLTNVQRDVASYEADSWKTSIPLPGFSEPSAYPAVPE